MPLLHDRAEAAPPARRATSYALDHAGDDFRLLGSTHLPQERGRALVEAILEAAEAQLDAADRGPLRDVFRRAGVGAGSFYEYFPSREALIEAVIERVTDRNFHTFLVDIDARVANEDDLEQLVRWASVMVVGRYCERPRQLRRLIHLAEQLGLVDRIHRERDRFSDLLSERVALYTAQMDVASR